jgi:transitional endoplasmic reticulum ATPase
MMDADMGFLEPPISFGDIAGHEEVKLALQDIALSIKLSVERPDLTLGIRSSKHSILLYGPPGTGKSMLACAMAKECQAKFILVDCETLIEGCTMYSRLSKKDQVKILFSEAVTSMPCVIFLDKVDTLPLFHFGLTPAFLQLLQELDEPRNGVIILASADNIGQVERMLLRKFRYKLNVCLPDEEARREIIWMQLREFEFANRFKVEDKRRIVEGLTKETSGFSGQEIREVCQNALDAAIRYELDEPCGKVVVKPYQFEMALETLKREREERVAFLSARIRR